MSEDAAFIALSCPQCRSAMSANDASDGLVCESCGATYPRVNGAILDLLAPGERPEDAYGDQFGSHAGLYDETFSVQSSHAHWVLKRLEELCPTATIPLKGKVIEIGAGTGPLTQALIESGPPRALWVTDLSPEMLELNRLKTRQGATNRSIEYARCNVLRMPFADAGADAIVGFDILHHVLDYRAGLTELARILSPGGVCIVKEPHRDAYRFLALVSWQLQAMDRHWNPLRGLTKRDHGIFEAWRAHTRDQIRADEEHNVVKIAGWDDKYYFRVDELEQCAHTAGFARFEEVNFLARHRPSHYTDGMFFADMIRDWLNGLGISKRGRAWADTMVRQIDYWVGDLVLTAAPINTLFVMWK